MILILNLWQYTNVSYRNQQNFLVWLLFFFNLLVAIKSLLAWLVLCFSSKLSSCKLFFSGGLTSPWRLVDFWESHDQWKVRPKGVCWIKAWRSGFRPQLCHRCLLSHTCTTEKSWMEQVCHSCIGSFFHNLVSAGGDALPMVNSRP